MKKIIERFVKKIMDSEIYKTVVNAIKNFFNEKDGSYSVISSNIDSYANNHADPIENGSDTANKIFKKVKKMAKVVKDKLNGTSTFAKIVKFVIKSACIVATGLFAFMVIKFFIKILPTVILSVAMIFAVAIAVELILGIINTATASSKNANVEA